MGFCPCPVFRKSVTSVAFNRSVTMSQLMEVPAFHNEEFVEIYQLIVEMELSDSRNPITHLPETYLPVALPEQE